MSFNQEGNSSLKVRRATKDDVQELGQLFADYRVFYKQEYELKKSIAFISQRLQNNESVVFIAIEGNKLAGFIQLYSSFTSIGIQEIWILNDLYIHPDYRRNGAAKMLLNYVFDFSKKTNRKKVILSTAFDNERAQRLYEKTGFTKTKFISYEKCTNHETTN